MTSKEMVHKYLNRFKASSRNYSETFESEMFNAILQDLNRLEELDEEYTNLKQDYDDKDFECIDLYKENQELRDLYEIATKGNWNLKEENTKLKKALEILKEEPYILVIGLENFAYDKFDNTYYYEEELYSQDLEFRNKLYVISKEKYNLLKEVLEDE